VHKALKKERKRLCMSNYSYYLEGKNLHRKKAYSDYDYYYELDDEDLTCLRHISTFGKEDEFQQMAWLVWKIAQAQHLAML